MITPTTITNLTLIREYVNAPGNYTDLLQLIISILQGGDSYREKTWCELVQCLKEAEAEGMVLILEEELIRLTESPDEILDFFQYFETLTGRGCLSSAVPSSTLDGESQFGMYVRASVLQFNSLPFASVSSLYDSLVSYFDDDGDMGGQHDDLEGEGSPNGYSCIAPKPQLRRFLHAHAVKSEAEIGRRSYEQTEAMLRDLHTLNSGRELPQAHFLRYLNCLHHREYEEALDSLHRYFDYLAPQEKKLNEQGPNKPNSIQQFAILNLAILYFGFGHCDQAVRAIQETVRIAQQNNDHTCLMHALALLCRVAQEKGAKGDTQHARELLEKCVMTQAHAAAKANKERQVFDASSDQKERESPPPAVPLVDSQSWLAVAKFQIENIDQKSGCSDPKTVLDALLHGVRLNTKHALQAVMGTNWLVRASAWQLFGNLHLSRVSSEMQLRFFGDVASTADSSLALCNLASSAQDSNTCSELLQFGQERWSYKTHCGFEELSAFARLDRAISRGDMTQAREIGREIFQLIPSKSENYQIFVESGMASAKLKYCDGQVTEALKEAHTMLDLCEAKGERAWMVKLLLWISKLYQEQGDHLSALPAVLQCLSLGKSLHFDSLQAEVTKELAKIHLSLGAPQKAVDILMKVLPQIMEHCEKHVLVDTWVVLAHCMMQLAAEEDGEGEEELIEASVHFLESAQQLSNEIQYFVQLKDICYTLARLYHHLGDHEKRNVSAMEFQRHREACAQ